MRTAILLHLLVFTSFGVFSQETIQRTSEVKTESGVSLKIDESLFIGNVIPSDLPKRSEFKSDEIYRKVIQGYINTHSSLVIEEKAIEMGFTYPSGDRPDEIEYRKTNRGPMKRTTPVSEEELRLKEQKKEQLEKQNKDNQ